MDKRIISALKSVKKIKTDAAEEIESVKSELAKTIREIDMQQTRIDNATVTGNFELYERAKEDKAKAESKREMLESRYKMLSESGGATFEASIEFAKLVNGIQKEAVEKAAEQLKPVIAEARKIINDALETVGEGNNALSEWHYTIRKFQPNENYINDAWADLYFSKNIRYGADVLVICERKLNEPVFYKVVGDEEPPINYNQNRVVFSGIR